MKFLKELAEHLYAGMGRDISKVCFVFPNRRAGLFFKKYLGQISPMPLFAPKIVTIQELFSELSGIRSADKLELIPILFEIYKKHSGEPIPFDEFYFWGEVLLNDFDDVDKYLVDARKLFTNVKDLKEIDDVFEYLSENQISAIKSFWTGFYGANGENIVNGINREKFIAVWKILWPIYEEFKRVLIQEKIGYEGHIHRVALDNLIQTIEIPLIFEKHSQFVFAGFNALSESERGLFKYLMKYGKAQFYWDYHGPLVNDKYNKASSFIERNLREFPSTFELKISGLPKIHIIGVPSESAQASVAAEIVSQCCNKTEDLVSNAVVLPDESLLLPVLQTIPDDVASVNVTMGMPLRGTAISALMESLTDFQTGDFYYKKVVSILKNSFISAAEPELSKKILKEIITGNYITVPRDVLTQSKLLSYIFTIVRDKELSPSQNIKNICRYLKTVIDLLADYEIFTPVEREFVYYYNTFLNRIESLEIPMNSSTFLKVLRQMTGSVTVPFVGEPLTGLQIMGILETRCLDFENMVFLSMNEGVYPVRNSPNTFIPYNLRRGFGLPAFEHQDAVMAYNFYSSISRAKEVWLIYDTRSEGFRSGEPSRYINQLKFHYANEIEGIIIDETLRTYNVKAEIPIEITIEKSPGIMEKIKSKFFSGGNSKFSATSLNCYIDCPLSFYFKYIMELGEEEEVEESMESGTFGSIFHDSINEIYSCLKDKNVTDSQLQKIVESTLPETTVDKYFAQYLKGSKIAGQDKIVRELLVKYVRQVLKYDATITPFTYVDGEIEYIMSGIALNGNEYKVYAKIDRIDSNSEGIKIIDYKTGNAANLNKEVEYYFRKDRGKKSNIMFQLMLYAKIVAANGVSDTPIVSPYILREIIKGEETSRFLSSQELVLFGSMLNELVSEIANPDVPFIQTVQTASKDQCKVCPFIKICNRTPYD